MQPQKRNDHIELRLGVAEWKRCIKTLNVYLGETKARERAVVTNAQKKIWDAVTEIRAHPDREGRVDVVLTTKEHYTVVRAMGLWRRRGLSVYSIEELTQELAERGYKVALMKSDQLPQEVKAQPGRLSELLRMRTVNEPAED